MLMRPLAVFEVEPHASYLRAEPDEHVWRYRPESIGVVGDGGETGATWKMIGGDVRDSIVSVDEWR